MFLSDFDDQQGAAFLHLAHELAQIDGLKDEEQELIEHFQLETGHQPNGTSFENIEAAAAPFSDRSSQVSVLLELIGLGYRDAEFTEHEREFVTRLCELFGLEREEIPVLESWVTRQMALYAEANELRQQ